MINGRTNEELIKELRAALCAMVDLMDKTHLQGMQNPDRVIEVRTQAGNALRAKTHREQRAQYDRALNAKSTR